MKQASEGLAFAAKIIGPHCLWRPALVGEPPGQGARPRDALDQKGKTVMARHGDPDRADVDGGLTHAVSISRTG